MNARADDASVGEQLVEYDEAYWDEIIAELPDDIESEPYAFSTGDYATHEEGMAALWNWLCTLGNGDPDEETGTTEPDTASA